MRIKRYIHKATIIFLFISSFLIAILGCCAVQAYAQEDPNPNITNEYDINADWLQINVKRFQERAPDVIGGSTWGKLHCETGGVSMTSFTPEGISYQDDDITIYTAHADFEFDMNWFTVYRSNDIFAYSIQQKDLDWFRLRVSDMGWLKSFEAAKSREAYWYNTMTLKYWEVKVNNYMPPVQTGHFTVSTQITDEYRVAEGNTIEIDGYQFKVPEIRAQILNVEVIGKETGILDDYDVKYSSSEYRGGSMDILNTGASYDMGGEKHISDYKNKFGKGWDEHSNKAICSVKTGMSDADWHWYTGNIQTGLNTGPEFESKSFGMGQWTGESEVLGLRVGRRYDYDLNENPEIFEFNTDPIILKAAAEVHRQEIRYHYARIYVDNKKEDLSLSPQYGVMIIKDDAWNSVIRTTGLKTQNFWIQNRFKVRVRFDCTVKPIGTESEKYMETPEMERGDLVFDNTIWGETDATIRVKNKNMWDNMWDNWKSFWGAVGRGIGNLLKALANALQKAFPWILIIGVIVIVIVVGVVYKLKKKRSSGSSGTTIAIMK